MKKYLKHIIVVFGLVGFIFSSATQARMQVLFHPYDPTLETIAKMITEAQRNIEIAMYNIDVTDSNPVVAALKQERIQSRLRSGDLIIKMIFEGYASPEENEKKMHALESLGIDVRFLGSSKKVHHKFAIFDRGTESEKLVTGSANWSLSSRLNYNENIMFFEGEPEIVSVYANEFDFLWDAAHTFEREDGSVFHIPVLKLKPSLQAHFNSNNFALQSGELIDAKIGLNGFYLTKQIVNEIDHAKETIQIATTRIKLRPIYDAILRAAKRGVKVQIVVTMGEYEFLSRRNKLTVPECENAFARECSVGNNYAMFLTRKDYAGFENVQLRIKWFDLNFKNYLSQQMHSKYMIVDSKIVLSGSFNWSYSSEYENIENLVRVDGREYGGVVKRFVSDFNRLWNQGRENYQGLLNEISDMAKNNDKRNICKIDVILLRVDEIDELFRIPGQFGKKMTDLCGN